MATNPGPTRPLLRFRKVPQLDAVGARLFTAVAEPLVFPPATMIDPPETRAAGPPRVAGRLTP